MDDERRCTGKSKRSGERCKRAASPGLSKCYIHAGVSRESREDAAVMERARKAVAAYGLPVDISASDALLEEVRYTAGHVAWLREKVRELEEDDLVWGVTEESDQQATEFPGVNTTRAAKPNVWLQLYREERKHLVDVAKAAVAAGIEERKVRLAEQQGALVARVIRGILGDLGLSAEQESKAAEAVPRHLRALAG